MKQIALIMSILMIGLLSGNVAYGQESWQMGENLNIGDSFVYEICDANFAFIPQNNQAPTSCYDLSLSFLNVIDDGEQTAWVAQADVEFAGEENRILLLIYDDFTIKTTTLEHISYTQSIENTIFYLKNVAKEEQSLDIGSNWGYADSASPRFGEILVRNQDGNIYDVGYVINESTIFQIRDQVPFPISGVLWNDLTDSTTTQAFSFSIKNVDLTSDLTFVIENEENLLRFLQSSDRFSRSLYMEFLTVGYEETPDLDVSALEINREVGLLLDGIEEENLLVYNELLTTLAGDNIDVIEQLATNGVKFYNIDDNFNKFAYDDLFVNDPNFLVNEIFIGGPFYEFGSIIDEVGDSNEVIIDITPTDDTLIETDLLLSLVEEGIISDDFFANNKDTNTDDFETQLEQELAELERFEQDSLEQELIEQELDAQSEGEREEQELLELSETRMIEIDGDQLLTYLISDYEGLENAREAIDNGLTLITILVPDYFNPDYVLDNIGSVNERIDLSDPFGEFNQQEQSDLPEQIEQDEQLVQDNSINIQIINEEPIVEVNIDNGETMIDDLMEIAISEEIDELRNGIIYNIIFRETQDDEFALVMQRGINEGKISNADVDEFLLFYRGAISAGVSFDNLSDLVPDNLITSNVVETEPTMLDADMIRDKVLLITDDEILAAAAYDAADVGWINDESLALAEQAYNHVYEATQDNTLATQALKDVLEIQSFIDEQELLNETPVVIEEEFIDADGDGIPDGLFDDIVENEQPQQQVQDGDILGLIIQTFTSIPDLLTTAISDLIG